MSDHTSRYTYDCLVPFCGASCIGTKDEVLAYAAEHQVTGCRHQQGPSSTELGDILLAASESVPDGHAVLVNAAVLRQAADRLSRGG